MITMVIVPGVKAQVLPTPYVRGNMSITIVVRYPEAQLTVSIPISVYA